MGFSLRERQLLGIHGLLPPAFMSQDQQAQRALENLKNLPDDLARYQWLNALQVEHPTVVVTSQHLHHLFAW